MGALTLPDSGPVYLDSCGFIYSVERVEPYRTLLEPMWQQAAAGQFVIVTSELTVLETLVKPLRESDAFLERLFRELFDAVEVRLIPATRPLWEEARTPSSHDEFEDAGRGPRGGGAAGRVYVVRHQ